MDARIGHLDFASNCNIRVSRSFQTEEFYAVCLLLSEETDAAFLVGSSLKVLFRFIYTILKIDIFGTQINENYKKLQIFSLFLIISTERYLPKYELYT